jgi:hypothetical protein
MKINKNIRVTESSVFEQCHLMVSACGYESRSVHASKKFINIIENKLCFCFSERKTHSFKSNYTWFKEHDFKIYMLNETSVSETLSKELLKFIGVDQVNIIVDYSSMNRKLLAEISYYVANQNTFKLLKIKFVYSPSEYVEPSDIEHFITNSGPILPEFSGGISDPSLPSVIFAGIGFEYDRTLGVIEFLESASVKAFVPHGIDKRFDAKVKELNNDLFQFIGEQNTIHYDLTNPLSLYNEMESLCYGTLQWGRPVFVPLGPKPFTLVALWVSLTYCNIPVVWRVSDDQNEEAIDRKAIGNLVEFELDILSSNDRVVNYAPD